MLTRPWTGGANEDPPPRSSLLHARYMLLEHCAVAYGSLIDRRKVVSPSGCDMLPERPRLLMSKKYRWLSNSNPSASRPDLRFPSEQLPENVSDTTSTPGDGRRPSYCCMRAPKPWASPWSMFISDMRGSEMNKLKTQEQQNLEF